MGIINKLFGKKKEVKQTTSTPKKKVFKPNTVEVNKIEESKTTLRYDEQIISIEAFRAGIKQGATIKAFRDGRFMPLRDLGVDLLIFDTNRDGYIPLLHSTNPQHQDVRVYVFGQQKVDVLDEELEEEYEDEEDYEEDEE
jgi:hypothetical protein